MDTKHTFGLDINGPINIFRMEGEVGGKTKTFFLMVDLSLSSCVCDQTVCEDIRALDVNNFIVRKFKELEKKDPTRIFDFMVPNDIINRYPEKATDSKIYLLEVHKIFGRQLPFRPPPPPPAPPSTPEGDNKQNGGKKNTKSTTSEAKIDIENNTPDKNIEEKKRSEMAENLPNVRPHFVSHILWVFPQIFETMNFLKEGINGIPKINYLGHELLDGLAHDLRIIMSDISRFEHFVFKIKPKNTDISFVENIARNDIITPEHKDLLFEKIVYDLKKTGTNSFFKDKINEIIDIEINENIDDFYKIMDQFAKIIREIYAYLDNFEGFLPFDILQKREKGYNYGLPNYLEENWTLSLFELFMKLRKIIDNIASTIAALDMIRILGKKETNNCVSYIGINSGFSLVRYLVQDFRFKITDVSYSKYDLAKCHEIINQSKSPSEIQVLFLPPLFRQCSSIKNFSGVFV